MKHILLLEQSKLIYKVVINKTKLNSKLLFISEVHEHNLRNISNIRLDTARTNKALHSPISLASEAYNSLPLEIRNITVLSIFVNRLKTYVNSV